MDPPAVAPLQGMARQRATLQATERMRSLKRALASVNDSIAFCDDQELHEAFNQVEAGVHKMGEALIKIAEAQQQQREADFLDSCADTVTMRPACAHAACAACAEARERLTRWLQTENRENVRAHRAQGHLPPPPTPNWMPGAPLPTGDVSPEISATVPADPVVALTAAADAAATPPPPPTLLPSDPYLEELPPRSRSASRDRSRSPRRACQ